jgi:acetyl esterase/lipase
MTADTGARLLGPPGATVLDVPYGPAPAHRLDIYWPAVPAPGDPAVLMLHGGAWRMGDKSGLAREAGQFAASGILAVSANYRLIDPAVPGTTWPVQRHDSELALAWLKANSGALRIDPARITAMGASAGGHLALFAGLPVAMSGAARAPLVAGVISLSGPTDLRAMYRTRPGMISALLDAGDAGPDDDAARAASPCTYVGAGGAPVLLLHGIADKAVPFAPAVVYIDALRDAQVPAWLLTHPGGHLLKGVRPKARALMMAAQIGFVQRHRLDAPPGRQDLV